jgi:hypothetical protein
MGKDKEANDGVDTPCKTEGLSQLSISETVDRGTVCGKSARTGLWGSGEVTNRSTRNQMVPILSQLLRCWYV